MGVAANDDVSPNEDVDGVGVEEAVPGNSGESAGLQPAVSTLVFTSNTSSMVLVRAQIAADSASGVSVEGRRGCTVADSANWPWTAPLALVPASSFPAGGVVVLGLVSRSPFVGIPGDIAESSSVVPTERSNGSVSGRDRQKTAEKSVNERRERF